MAKPHAPKITNLAMAAADTEYSVAIPAGTKLLDIQVRDASVACRIAFETGKVGTPTNPVWSIHAGQRYTLTTDVWGGKDLTVYAAHDAVTAQVLEIISWS